MKYKIDSTEGEMRISSCEPRSGEGHFYLNLIVKICQNKNEKYTSLSDKYCLE